MGIFDSQVVGNPMFAAPVQGPTGPVVDSYKQPNGGMPALKLAPELSPAMSAGASSPSFNPMNLISLAGMVAGALAPNTAGARVGQVAAQGAQTQLMADAQLKRDNDYRKFLTEALKFHTPAEIGALANQQVGNQGYWNPANGVGNPYVEPPKGNGTGGA